MNGRPGERWVGVDALDERGAARGPREGFFDEHVRRPTVRDDLERLERFGIRELEHFAVGVRDGRGTQRREVLWRGNQDRAAIDDTHADGAIRRGERLGAATSAL